MPATVYLVGHIVITYWHTACVSVGSSDKWVINQIVYFFHPDFIAYGQPQNRLGFWIILFLEIWKIQSICSVLY